MRFQSTGKLRKKDYLRDWMPGARLGAGDIIMPYFIVPGTGIKEPVSPMPGIFRYSPDTLAAEVASVEGLRAVLLFGAPGADEKKDKKGSNAYDRNGALQRGAAALKEKFSGLTVITGVCLCGHTSHGHCGILNKDGTMDSAKTLRALAKTALTHARAGADLVAPSAMADGQVSAIREILDSEGYQDTGILSYSAKFASSFYGPFRDALGSAPASGDRKGYQLDPGSAAGALREIEEDIREGADIVMVKPALAYLDIITRAREKFNVPLAAYSVSGEYSIIKNAAAGDAEKERSMVSEVLVSIKRAGADFIITYFGKEVLRWLTQ